MSRSSITEGSTLSVFLRFAIPSTINLLAISTASIVDGIFIGNYVGAKALSAVNLLIPFFSFVFGIALMLSIGGSVRASRYLGEGRAERASQTFSKTLIAIFVLNAVILLAAYSLDTQLFSLLRAEEGLHGLMSSYFTIICLSLYIQLFSLALYYFSRADDRPKLGTAALLSGALANILLDWLFVGVLQWGLQGAAAATLIAQCLQALVLLSYFLSGNRRLRFKFAKTGWGELLKTSYNGLSEFVNEISVGVVIFTIHWIIAQQSGTQGIAAFSIVNYLIFISVMTCCGIVDALHALISQNLGAGKIDRVKRFMAISAVAIALVVSVIVALLQVLPEAIVGIFLQGDEGVVRMQAISFINLIWPMFLVNGFNVLVCAYLTASQRPSSSAIISFLKNLILPVGIALFIFHFAPSVEFVVALPIAEWITFIVAVALFIRFRPSRIMMLS